MILKKQIKSLHYTNPNAYIENFILFVDNQDFFQISYFQLKIVSRGEKR